MSTPEADLRGCELNQVCSLLDIAIDALGDRGTITISTRREAHSARVQVTDDGPGIAPEIRERARLLLHDQGRRPGIGLGLATAHRIAVERQRGSIAADSEPGRTTFHVLAAAHAGLSGEQHSDDASAAVGDE